VEDDWRTRMQPRADYRPPPAARAGWGREHREHHDYRFWDGSAWTNRVVDAGEESTAEPRADAWPPVVVFDSVPAEAVVRISVACSGSGGGPGAFELVSSSGLCSLDPPRWVARTPSISPVHEVDYQLLASVYGIRRKDSRFSFGRSRVSFVHRDTGRIDAEISVAPGSVEALSGQLARTGFVTL